MTAPQIQHPKGLCVSTPNKRPPFQTLFFTHDVVISSNYAYLSLQTHQLSAISAVIGNKFTIVKLQFKCPAHVKKHLSSQGKQLKNTISEEESRVVPNEVFPIYAVYLCVDNNTASKNRTLE